MAHYICTGGCEGVSDSHGSCKAQSCMKYNMPLTECNCTDGQHKEVVDKIEHPEQTESK